MPWFGSARRKPVGRRVGGQKWSWTWEPETPPGRWRRWCLLGGVALAAAVLAVGLAVGFTLLDDGGEGSRPSSSRDGREDAPSLAGLAGAISVSLPDGSEPDGGLFADRCDVYLTTGRSEVAHSLPNGEYVFQVTDVSGRLLLSTDEARLRQVRIDDGVLRGVSGQGSHGMGDDGLAGGSTVQLCPFDVGQDASGAYQLWLTPVEDFQGDLEAVDSEAEDFHGFLVKRSLVVVFGVMPEK